ncbi:MAG: serine--tRNA ligase [Alphaproteobacteria bacterium]
MLDKKYILENINLIQKSAKNKGFKIDLHDFQKLNTEISHLKTEYEKQLAEKNRLSKEIGKGFIKDVNSGDESDKAKGKFEEFKNLVKRSKEATKLAKSIDKELLDKEESFKEIMLHIPQVHFDDAPIGSDDSGNVVIKTVGKKTDFNFIPKDHYDLLEANDWADFSITNITGPRAYSLKGEMARLELAIHLFILDKLTAEGFTQFTVPALCKPQAIYDAGHFPGSDLNDLKDDVYFLNETDLCLAGTSEIVLNSLHKNQILDGKSLPKLYAGYSPAFRKESGASGKDTRGLVRVHQFSKVEQFVFCKVGESQKYFDKLLGILESVMQDLELPYQLLETCSGDMGFNKIRMIDVEAWVPTQKKYRELGSCSMIGDFQSRRTNTRYRGADGKVSFAETLNNTGIATPRVLAPLIENHQREDGKIKIPTKLQPYMNGKKTIG